MTQPLPPEFAHDPNPMTPEKALEWLKQVDGVIFHNKEEIDLENTWVAVVRTPAAGPKAGRIILAFGESMEEAAGAAEAQWDQIWTGLSSVH
jgi:hypothetical protein